MRVSVSGMVKDIEIGDTVVVVYRKYPALFPDEYSITEEKVIGVAGVHLSVREIWHFWGFKIPIGLRRWILVDGYHIYVTRVPNPLKTKFV